MGLSFNMAVRESAQLMVIHVEVIDPPTKVVNDLSIFDSQTLQIIRPSLHHLLPLR